MSEEKFVEAQLVPAPVMIRFVEAVERIAAAMERECENGTRLVNHSQAAFSQAMKIAEKLQRGELPGDEWKEPV